MLREYDFQKYRYQSVSMEMRMEILEENRYIDTRYFGKSIFSIRLYM